MRTARDHRGTEEDNVNDEHKLPLIAFVLVAIVSAVVLASSARGQALVAVAQARVVEVVSAVLLEPDATASRVGTPSAAPSGVEPAAVVEPAAAVEPASEPASPRAGRVTSTPGHQPRVHGQARGHDKVHEHGQARGHDKAHGPDRAHGHGTGHGKARGHDKAHGQGHGKARGHDKAHGHHRH